MVSEQRTATKENVQRKQARTEGERDDSDAEASATDSEGEDLEDVPYNPKNLPLGEPHFYLLLLNPLKKTAHLLMIFCCFRRLGRKTNSVLVVQTSRSQHFL